jgi:hypothetical protein
MSFEAAVLSASLAADASVLQDIRGTALLFLILLWRLLVYCAGLRFNDMALVWFEAALLCCCLRGV